MLDHVKLVMKDRLDFLVFADDERVSPGQTDEGPEYVVGSGDAFVRVGDQGEGHVEFAGEATLRIELVGADADEVGASEEQFVEIIGESACFPGALGRECFGEEVDDGAQALLFGQDEGGAFVCLGGDIGCPITYFERRHLDAVPS